MLANNNLRKTKNQSDLFTKTMMNKLSLNFWSAALADQNNNMLAMK